MKNTMPYRLSGTATTGGVRLFGFSTFAWKPVAAAIDADARAMKDSRRE